MKTSLTIEESLYRAARKEALRSGRSLSEIITSWAKEGLRSIQEKGKQKKPELKSVDLGDLNVDISSRRDWLDIINPPRLK